MHFSLYTMQYIYYKSIYYLLYTVHIVFTPNNSSALRDYVSYNYTILHSVLCFENSGLRTVVLNRGRKQVLKTQQRGEEVSKDPYRVMLDIQYAYLIP